MDTVGESKLTSKGQVTVPEVIRRRLNLQAGDRLEWRVEDEGLLLVRRIGRSLDEVQGMLGRPDRRVTVDGMDEALRRRARRGPDVRR